MTNVIIDHYYIDYVNYFYDFMFVLLNRTFTFNLEQFSIYIYEKYCC